MKLSNIIKLLCWSIVAIVLLGVLIAGLQGKLLPEGWGSLPRIHLGPGDAAFDGEPVTGEMRVKPVSRIEIEWIAGQIAILPYDGEEICFEQTADNGIPEKRRLHYRVSGDTLALREGKGGNITGTIDGTSLTLYLPRTLYLDLLSVEAASARLQIDYLRAEQLDIETASANTTLGDITVQSLELDSASGALISENLNADTVELDMTSGRVELNGHVREFSCDTVSGAVSLNTGICPEHFDVNAFSADVTLFLPPNNGFTATLDSLSGKLICAFPSQLEDGEARYGDGGAEFSVDTLSGSFAIQRR